MQDPAIQEDDNSIPDADQPASDLPPGNHPLEIAARDGIGPLSPLGQEAWHGRARPCVSCGQLVLRESIECPHCNQNLSPDMIEKMRAHAGPWYVLEHIRPFPGVSLERIVLQLRRGLITPTSIVRGPSTDYQWRFALETPGLCRFFKRCWKCQEPVSNTATHCKHCLSHLSFDQPVPKATAAADPATQSQNPESRDASASPTIPDMELPPCPQPKGANLTPAQELQQLSAAVGRSDLPAHETLWGEPPRVGGVRATWIAAGMLVIVIVVLMFITGMRNTAAERPAPATPGLVQPIR